MRIAVVHPQTPFVRGGAETHTESVVTALKQAGHDAEEVVVAGKWYPATELVHQMAVWRALDLSESNGEVIDMVIALKFPAYLVPHERKVVWLIHQHRSAYELWDHPEFADLGKQVDGPAVRDMIHQSDRISLGEAKRIFTNSRNVQQRLWTSLRLTSDVLYHPSPLSTSLMDREVGPLGDHVVFPSRLEGLKRQALVVEAMKHVKTGVRLVLVGEGPDEEMLAETIAKEGLGSKVQLAGRVSDERLRDLYETALGVYYGPFDEDYGYVTLEAFLARKPLVTTSDAGGPLEFVVDGVNGLVSEPVSESIAAAVNRVAADTGLAARLGDAGYERARQVTWHGVVERLVGAVERRAGA